MEKNVFEGSRFITAEREAGRAPLVSREFDAEEGGISSAVLYATALGVYEASLNGIRVSASVLNPGWTAYEWRRQYQEFEVADLITATNRLSFTVGNGWWRGHLGFVEANANYGTEIGVQAVLKITYDDGRVQRITTDSSWSGASSHITANSLYNGQSIDFRLAPEPADLRVLDDPGGALVPQAGPLITRHEILAPVRIWDSPSGKTLVDFGQNLVGWLRFSVTGERGTRIVIRHAEVLENGELGVRPLRGAKATDILTLSGSYDFFEPTFTFHGFRYAEITGWPGELTPADLEAVVVHSELNRTSRFECSNDLVNQFMGNVIWGQKGNFLDIPTDCPQRDERLGWTGDIAAFAPTAAFNYDVADFLHKWLMDLLEETRARSGAVPVVVPDPLKYATFPEGSEQNEMVKEPGATAIWGDAAVWVPEALWHAYGDRDRLAAHYPAMVLHTDLVQKSLSPNGLWDSGFQFGDWLDPDAPADDPGAAKADRSVVATACAYRTARFTARAAAILGKTTEAGRYEQMAKDLKDAFASAYVSADGRITSDCTTVYSLAIHFGLLDGGQLEAAGQRLAELVRDSGYRISTGFAGTPYIAWALSGTGHADDAYRLLLQTECPSWLYPVTMGATTVWERWDSMLPDGSINPGEMTSFNHYALGAVADWLYQVVAGIRPAEPGFAAIRIEPLPGPGLDWAQASVDTRQGPVSSSWRRTDGELTFEVSIPGNTPAEIVLPSGAVHRVSGGTHSFRE